MKTAVKVKCDGDLTNTTHCNQVTSSYEQTHRHTSTDISQNNTCFAILAGVHVITPKSLQLYTEIMPHTVVSLTTNVLNTMTAMESKDISQNVCLVREGRLCLDVRHYTQSQ